MARYSIDHEEAHHHQRKLSLEKFNRSKAEIEKAIRDNATEYAAKKKDLQQKQKSKIDAAKEEYSKKVADAKEEYSWALKNADIEHEESNKEHHDRQKHLDSCMYLLSQKLEGHKKKRVRFVQDVTDQVTARQERADKRLKLG